MCSFVFAVPCNHPSIRDVNILVSGGRAAMGSIPFGDNIHVGPCLFLGGVPVFSVVFYLDSFFFF